MNKSAIITVLLIISFLGYFMFVAPKANKTLVSISGEITNPIGDTVKFMTRDTSYVTTIDSLGMFAIEFDLDSATYLSFFHGVESTAMYLKLGDKVDISIEPELFDESITYTGSEESSYLAWQYLFQESRPSVDWFKISEQELDSQFMVLARDMNAELEKFKISNALFYDVELGKISSRESYIRDRREVLASLPQPGDDPIDFTYPDLVGDEVSLSDFVGSVVYVDVWATWCGPCKAEIPFLHDLEQEYRDNDVVFMSVSVDVEKNKQAWLDMIADKDMKGVQLFADGWSQITKDYAINGIPRFMLFDAEGKVADLNAPRPSSDDIRPALDALLN
jgi:thiol-disulfide isomerase/thioredoxin